MRIGITGANGFIGRELVGTLAAAGHEPVALVRKAGRTIEGAVETRAIGDIGAGPVPTGAFAGLEVVVHLAARVHVMHDRASDPLAAFRAVNTAGTLALAEAAHSAGVRRFVFASSIKVNGEETAPGRPFIASDAPAPVDPYGISKTEAEAGLAALAARSGLEVVIVRPPLVYGPGAGGNFARLAGAVRRGLPLPLAAIDNRRSLVALENLADFLMTAATHPAAAGGTFLVSDGFDLSTADLVRRMGRVLGRPARLWPVPVALLRLAGRLSGHSAEIHRLTSSLQVDISAARECVGWTPPASVEAAIARAVTGHPAPRA